MKNSVRVCALLASALFFSMQSVIATDITGVTGNNGVYDISPTSSRLDYGFRNYQNFNLSQGDVANLIFHLNGQDLSTFVNMVDNQISINGLVKAVNSNGVLNNGHAIFISPNGMVVGDSGVLRVGSLSVYAPTQSKYDNFKANPTLGVYQLDDGNADITINGKIIAKDTVRLSAKNLETGNNAAIFTGINDTTTSDANIFNNLVNTSVKSSNSFAAQDGKIFLKSNSAQGSSNIYGDIRNYAQSGEINVTTASHDGAHIGANLKSNDKILVSNTNGYLTIDGNIDSKNHTRINSNGSGLFIGDYPQSSEEPLTKITHIRSDNLLQVWNTGSNGMSFTNASIDGYGTTNIQNDAGTLALSGVDVYNSNNGNMTINSAGSGGIRFSSQGEQNSEFAFYRPTSISNNGTLKIWNTGTNGTNISADLYNNANGRMVIQNYNGNMRIATEGTNAGNLNIINDGNKLSVVQDGYSSDLTNSGYLGILNNGQGGADISRGVLNTGRMVITNTNGNMNVAGSTENSSVVNNGNMSITNKSGKLTANKFYNSGNLNIWNTGAGGMDAPEITNQTNSARLTVLNEAGNLNILSKGNNTIENGAGSQINIVNKSGSLNINQNAHIANDGLLAIRNEGGNGMNVNGIITNNGTVNVVNKSGALNVGSNASVNNNGSTTFLNNSTNGMTFNGTITNSTTQNRKQVKIKSTAGGLNFGGNVIGGNNTKVAFEVKDDFDYAGNVSNSGMLSMLHSGADDFTINGVISNEGNAIITNSTGDMNITNSTITNTDGKLNITNRGDKLEIVNSSITNDGTLKIWSNGSDGLNVTNSEITNSTGNAAIQNDYGSFDMSNSNISNTGGKTTITNKGANGLTFTDSTVSGNGNVEIQNISGTNAVITKPAGSANPVTSTSGSVLMYDVDPVTHNRSVINVTEH